MNHVAPIRRSYPRDNAECGHGTCGAVVDCTGECALKAAVLNLPVIDTMTDDRFNLHRVDATQLGPRDGGSAGACRTDMPIQYADDDLISEVKKDGGWFKRIALAIGAGILLALVIAVSSK